MINRARAAADDLESLPWLRAGAGTATGAGPVFVIAEVGQNHQGDLGSARLLIAKAKECGAHCVKFQKTCIEEKFTKAALEKSYLSRHSWGKTYGDHKRFLEFTDDEFRHLQQYANEIGILFTASAMDKVSLDFLCTLNVPFIKIGSGDSNNIPLIEYAASKMIPLIISTGMIDKQQVTKIYETVRKYHTKFCLLHCISSYPVPVQDCNLNVITDYKSSYPEITIGYSGHEAGITVTLGAVTLGAKVVERHFTLDKSQKGSDHICSLTPGEMTSLINEINILTQAFGDPIKKIANSEKSCIDKLQKSLTAACDITKGSALNISNVAIKVSEPKGVNAIHYADYLGRTILVDKLKDEPLYENDFII